MIDHKEEIINVEDDTRQIPDRTDRTLFIPQYQLLCNEQFSRKARGQITIHEQWQLLFIKQCPDRIIQFTVCFQLKRNSPMVKAILYIYIYVEGHVAELAPPHTQSVWGLREKRFKLQESGKKGSSCGVSNIL